MPTPVQARDSGFARDLQISKVHRLADQKVTFPETGVGNSARFQV